MIIQTVHKVIGTQVIDHMVAIPQEAFPPNWDSLSQEEKVHFILSNQEFEEPYAIRPEHFELLDIVVVKDYTF